MKNMNKVALELAKLAASPEYCTLNIINACKEFCAFSNEHKTDFIICFREQIDLQKDTIASLSKLKW